MQQLLTVQEAATYLKVSPKTVWRYIKLNDLKATRYGWEWLIDINDLKSFRKPKMGRPS